MTHEHDCPDPLAAHFEALKARAAEPDAAFFARILADAAREQAAQAERTMACRTAPARPGRLVEWLRALGGWPALTGLAAATLAGVWIGAAPPAALAAAAARVLGGDAAALVIDVDPDADFILADGSL